MEAAIISGIQGLLLGFSHLQIGQPIMMVIGGVLLYLGIRKGFEPLLLVPIGFGAILVNIPQAELMAEGGTRILRSASTPEVAATTASRATATARL